MYSIFILSLWPFMKVKVSIVLFTLCFLKIQAYLFMKYFSKSVALKKEWIYFYNRYELSEAVCPFPP